MSHLLMDVLEEHLDEAAFLWLQWERSLVAPHFVLHEVAGLEERLLAHVDGLVIGGAPAADKLLIPALEAQEDVERVTAAAYTLLGSEDPSLAGTVRTALESASPEALPAFQRALELRGFDALPSWLSTLLKQEEPARLALALEVLATHGVDPGPVLPDLLRHEEPHVAAAALRVAARLRYPLDRQVLQAGLTSSVSALRDSAIIAGLQKGHRAAWTACQAAVDSKAPEPRLPALVLALSGDAREVERLKRLLEEPHHRPDALWALGFSGQPAAAELCLPWMEDEATSHLAAESFCAITGLSLEGRLVSPRTEEEPLPPLEEEALEVELTPRPEDDLPRPVASEVLAWWKESRKNFEPDRRYLHGRPFGTEALLESLQTAPMRRRHALALDLALRSRGELRVPTRAFTPYQWKALETVRTAVPSALSRPFTDGLHSS
ncbi:MAG TPA: TIGR02270 family protein [Archangium sp.]|uniref:TIGR02270 family protein n=1 Tax=Archangium sp. TaxID=1872627 RepID=UPI002E37C337|nr:TIGR02270 family protein [Archangium sp.]HEX5748771.1 TIGR02270 family protein [Archangium sp.]